MIVIDAEEKPANENRLGKFIIDFDLLDDWPDLLPVFKGLVIVEANSRYANRTVEYTAYCAEFDDLGAMGSYCLIPEYICTVHTTKGVVSKIEWKRTDTPEPYEEPPRMRKIETGS